MRIGINTLFEDPRVGTGGITYIRNLVGALSRVDRENKYVLFVSPLGRGLFPVPSSNFCFVDCPFSKERRFAAIAFEHLALPLLIRKHRIEVFHSPGNIAPIWLPCASVVTVHTLHHYLLPQMIARSSRIYRRALMPRSVSRADVIIAVSNYLRSKLIELLDVEAEKIDTIYEAVDESFSKNSKPPSPWAGTLPEKYILFVSALWPYKNVHTVLKALGLLNKNYSGVFPLVVAGSGWDSYRAQLTALAREEGLEGSVIFLGHVPNDWIGSLYARASLLVYPSLEEYFGFPLLEAMTAGTPVVASNRSSIPEVIGDAGILIDPENPREIAAAIWSVMHDASLRGELIERGLRRAREFTWEGTAVKTVKAYELAHQRWLALSRRLGM